MGARCASGAAAHLRVCVQVTGAPHSRGPLVPLIIGAALFMQSLTATVIAAALPAMAEALDEPVLSLNLAITAYLVGAAVFLPISGWLADRFGARTILLAAVIGFVSASVLCGLSQSIGQLVAARTLQGFAAAMMLPVGRLVLLRTTPKEELVAALSYLAIPMLIGPTLGPPLGAFIVTYLSWPWIFFVNVPIGAIGAVLIWRFVHDVRGEGTSRLDVLGFLLSGIALACIVYGLESLGGSQLPRAFVYGLVGFGAIASAAYIFYAGRVRNPILEMRLFRTPTFSAATLGGFFMRLKLGATPFLLALLFQIGFGMSALAAGWLIFTSSVGALAMRTMVAQTFARFGFRLVLLINGVLVALTFAGVGLLRPTTPIWFVATLLLMHGFVRSLQLAGLNALAYADLDDSDMSAASTLAGVFQMLAQAVAVGGAATILNLAQSLDGAHALAAVHIYPAFLIIGGLSLVSLIWFARLPRDAGASLRGA